MDYWGIAEQLESRASGKGDGSVVKNSDRFLHRTGVQFPDSHDSLQLSVTPDPEDLRPFSGLGDQV